MGMESNLACNFTLSWKLPRTKPYLVKISKGPLGLESWENGSLVPLSKLSSLSHPHQSQPFCLCFPIQVWPFSVQTQKHFT